MTYEELSALQYGRSKSFSEAQTEAMAAYCQAEHDLKQLQQENAKLRELVRIMAYCMQEGTDCDGCKLNDGTGRIEALDAFWACDGLHERLRELGVEL